MMSKIHYFYDEESNLKSDSKSMSQSRPPLYVVFKKLLVPVVLGLLVFTIFLSGRSDLVTNRVEDFRDPLQEAHLVESEFNQENSLLQEAKEGETKQDTITITLNDDEDLRDDGKDASKSQARIGIATLNFGKGGRHSFKAEKGRAADLYEQSHDILSAYSEKWGYELTTCTHGFIQQPLNAERKGLLSKEGLVLSIILQEMRKEVEEERLRWVYFMDADTLIMNHNIPLETFLPSDEDDSSKEQILVAAFDQWNTLNSGAFFIRVSEESVQFLSTILATGVTLDPEIWHGSDQALMAITAKQPAFIDKVSIVPAHWFNSDAFAYFVPDSFNGKVKPVYRYGDFMIHFMGGGKYKKGWAGMAEYAMSQRNETISPALTETRYIQGEESVANYWKTWLSMSQSERHDIIRSCVDVTERVNQH